MKKCLLNFLFLLFTSFSFSQLLVTFQPLATGLAQPLDIATANDGRLYIVEKAGTIRIWTGTALISTPFLNISSLVRSTGFEQGLLSLVFHPNYASNGYFYVYYTILNGDVVLARYTRTSLNVADPASGVILMTIYQPFANHNGGKLNFGPDGYLYFGTGDGGSSGDPGNRAQNGDSILGKMVRIDVNNPIPPYYSIPPTNPYIGNASIRDEIIALGLRNPWRWSFDKSTGDMWIADVGQNQWEEINVVAAANTLNKNYGWPCYEGTHVFKATCTAQPNNVFPVFEYPHNNTSGGFSVTGGYRYRGSEFPFLQGYYMAVDYVSGNGWLISPNGSGGWNSIMQTWITGISSFGEDANGTLFAVSLSNGTLYKILASDPLPVRLTSFVGSLINNAHQLKFTVQNEEEGDVYTIEKSSASSTFIEVYSTTATSQKASNTYTISLPVLQPKTQYRLKITGKNQQVRYSQVITLGINNKAHFSATVVGNNLVLNHSAGTTEIEIFDAVGRLLQKAKVSPGSTQTSLPIDFIYKGVLTLRSISKDEVQITRIMY